MTKNRSRLQTIGLSLVVAFILAMVAVPVWTPRLAFAATSVSFTFDFDGGIPSLSEGQNIPFNQTSGEVTAYFSSPSGPAAFSIQSDSTTFFKLSQLPGKYLYDNGPLRDTLEIKFSHYLNNIELSFATIQYRGASGDEPSNITLIAYIDSTATAPVGSVIARGTWSSSGDSHPQGTITFNSGTQQFNLVKIELPYESQRGAVDFLVDNITVTATEIIPEFSLTMILTLTIAVTTVTLLISKKTLRYQQKQT